MAFALVGTVNGTRVSLELRDGDQVVGRAPESDIRLEHRSVSRRHALVSVAGGRVTVTDLGSRNGTRVDGARIAAPTPARAGSRIAFADVSLTLRAPGPPESTEYCLSASAVVTSAVPVSALAGPTGERGAGRDLFRVLADAGQFLVSERPLEGIYEDVLGLVERAIACDRIVLLSLEGEARTPTVRASRLPSGRGRGDELVLSTTMVRQVLEDGVSLLTSDAQADPRFGGHDSVVRQGIRAAMAAPLFDNHEIIGLLYADTTDPSSRYGEDELRAFTVLANLIAVKITQARLTEAEEERKRFERELGTAREILGHILPETVEGVDHYEISVSYTPCAEVGGDLYDVRHLEDGRSVIMAGDVAGKGLGAAILVSSIVPVAEVLLGGERDLVSAVSALNRQVCASTDAVRYATLFVAALDRASGRLDYVNAGHNAPILVTAAGAMREIAATGMPIGMLEDAPYAAASLVLEPGSSLVVFSDGVTEAVGRDGEFYGEERLRRALGRAVAAGGEGEAPSASDLVSLVMDDLGAFTAGAPQSDDILLLVVKRTPNPV
ncbi:MAG: SpoIIE family protein phosphatase [Candidatus Eisenbacteria bacterium]|nr:SpoIIE family protein phosphatase [Candidatus Eisenbacteria bacterium]